MLARRLPTILPSLSLSEALLVTRIHSVAGRLPFGRPLIQGRPGGAWFIGPGLALHLGVEEPFRAARTAHPALIVADLARARRRLEAAGVEIEDDGSGLPIHRCYVSDPFGNRIELLDAADAGFTDAHRS
jgi:catechol 2,3-dioxygenase-like lactoylglutathione lyase family enzyme